MPARKREEAPFVFEGFDGPNGTQIPDVFFDRIMHRLSEAELRVCLYVMRRTFGFKRDADTISLKQMAEGITKHDGSILDYGTGLAKSSVAVGIKGLVAKGILVAERNEHSDFGHLPTTYRLHFRGNPLSGEQTRGVRQTDKPLTGGRTRLVRPPDTQQTVLQQTVVQDPPTPIREGQTDAYTRWANTIDEVCEVTTSAPLHRALRSARATFPDSTTVQLAPTSAMDRQQLRSAQARLRKEAGLFGFERIELAD